MRSIANTPAAQRFLMVAWRLSERAWRSECESLLNNWLSNNLEGVKRSDRDEMQSIIQRPLASTEHPFVVIHCYADVPTDTTWNVVFDPRNLADHDSTTVILKFGVVLQRQVSRSLAHGWHQTAIIDFPKGLPNLIHELPVDPDTQSGDYACLCAEDDFDEISRMLGSDS